MKKSQKTNLEHLKDILSDLRNKNFSIADHIKKLDEGIEFFEEIERDFDNIKDELKSKETELNNANSEAENIREELENKQIVEEHFVGLDTLYIGYKDGNIRIMGQVEEFIEKLKKQNAVYAS